MNWFAAKIYDPLMAGTEEAGLRDWRAELLSDVSGRVLEIGGGTGVNLPLYGEGVEELVVTEPSRPMRTQLEERLAETHPPMDVRVEPWKAEDIPGSAASFDVVVAMLVLCSVDDLGQALSEIHRVLRPGGELVFIEHVAAAERPGRLRWQKILEPVWKRVAGNCHLTRHTGEAIDRAGFQIDALVRESMRKAPAFVRPTIRGTAVRPEASRVRGARR